MVPLSDIHVYIMECKRSKQNCKVKEVFKRIRQIKAKIVFLQETHLVPEDVIMVRKRWLGQVFSASFNSYSRGFLYLYINLYLYK